MTPRPARCRMRRSPARTARRYDALFRADAPKVVDDIPDVAVGQLALVALHVELGTGAVLNDREDLAVGRAAIPFGVGQVRGMRPLGGHWTVALRVSAMAEAAVLREQL